MFNMYHALYTAISIKVVQRYTALNRRGFNQTLKFKVQQTRHYGITQQKLGMIRDQRTDSKSQLGKSHTQLKQILIY